MICNTNSDQYSSQTFLFNSDADITERLRTMNLHGPSKIQVRIKLIC